MATREIRFPRFGGAQLSARRGRLLQDLLGGAVILVAWLVLWSFFALAIVEPAARFRAAAASGAARAADGQVL